MVPVKDLRKGSGKNIVLINFDKILQQGMYIYSFILNSKGFSLKKFNS